MNPLIHSRGLLALFFFLATALGAAAQEPTYRPPSGPGDFGEPPPVPGEDVTTPADPAAPPDVEVQARGPVHEAFARPSEVTPRPGPVVPKKPPQPVPEVPPDQKPEGQDVVWIPGYWAWDLDRKDFLWVSGVWRVPPPGRKWTPGAWQEVEGGWQWMPGFWAAASADSLPYLPEPPTSLDNGPSSPAPDEDSFYIPGNWVYRNDDYAWRPGFWSPCRENWIWTPSCYYWTPSGYVCVDGYWDYSLANRGLLFAPVCFNRALWLTPGWAYQPSYCITPSLLTSALFLGPGRSSLYFGNYYGPAYRDLGFRPWYGGSPGNTLFSYYRWRNGANLAWYSGLRSTYAGRFSGTLTPPAATLAEQNRLLARSSASVANSLHIVRPLHEIHTHVPLTRLSHAQVQQARLHAERIQQHVQVRTAPHTNWASHSVAPHGNVPHGPGAHLSTQPSGGHGFATERHNSTVHTPAHNAPPVMHQSFHSGGAPSNHAPPAVHHAPAPVHHAPAHTPAPSHHAPAPTHHASAPSHHAPAHAAAAHRGGGGHGGGHHR
jgi:hypothetical protein